MSGITKPETFLLLNRLEGLVSADYFGSEDSPSNLTRCFGVRENHNSSL